MPLSKKKASLFGQSSLLLNAVGSLADVQPTDTNVFFVGFIGLCLTGPTSLEGLLGWS